MAETVGFHVERMIPELEQMKRLKLFSHEEIVEIIKKRKEFEHKIERQTKEKPDFLTYINYEVKLIREIKLRRDKFRISEKKDEIEYAVTKRVIKLYKMALAYFKADVKLWLNYINFCTQTKFLSAVSEAFKQMLQVHADKIYCWKHAAKWELEERSSIESALSVLKSGLHHHPTSQELYLEAFRLELVYAKMKPKNPAEDETTRKEMAVRRASVHFRTSIKSIDDVQYCIQILEIATEHEFTDNLQAEIIEHLTTNCWKHEAMWHTMAQRELHGHHYDKSRRNSRIQLCIAVYKSAVEVLATASMWEKYLDCLIDLYLKKKSSIKDILVGALEDAYTKRFLLEKHYLSWIEILSDADDAEARANLLVKATSVLPESATLWIARLQHLQSAEDLKTVSDLAIVALKNKALPIYKYLIQYNILQNNNSAVNEIYEEGMRQHADIAMELRPMFIEWICISRHIKQARVEYDRIARYTPYCLELHKKMLYLENTRLGSTNLNLIRSIHMLAYQQFGKECTDVWIDYIKFAINSGDSREASNIYNLAINTLNEDLVSTFVAEYSLLHCIN